MMYNDCNSGYPRRIAFNTIIGFMRTHAEQLDNCKETIRDGSMSITILLFNGFWIRVWSYSLGQKQEILKEFKDLTREKRKQYKKEKKLGRFLK